jgi:hypothetical protein
MTSSAKHGLGMIPLLSDEDSDVCERYGVWKEKSMYGKKYMGIERTTFLIDADGQDRAGLAEGEGAGPCRGGARGGEGAVTGKSLAQMAVEVLADHRRRARERPRCRAPCRPVARRARQATPRHRRGHPAPAPGAARETRASRPPRRAAPPPGSAQGRRIAILHAVAHIELNAVDLHWDIIARFAHIPMPLGFYRRLGARRRTRNRSISTCLRRSLKRWAAITAPCPPMPACGAPPRTRPRT